MYRQRLNVLFTGCLFILDAAAFFFAFWAAYHIRFQSALCLTIFPATKGIPPWGSYLQGFWAFLPMGLLVFFYARLYSPTAPPAFDEAVRVVKAVSICILLAMALTFVYRDTQYSRLVLLLTGILTIAGMYSVREIGKVLFARLLRLFLGPQRILVLGKGKLADALKGMVRHHPFLRVYFFPGMEEATLLRFLKDKRISEVLLLQSSLSTTEVLTATEACERRGADCKVVPDLLEMRRGEIIVDGSLGLPTFHLKPLSLHGLNFWLKHSFDILTSILIFAVLFFPLLAIAVLIRLDAPGPVFYHQSRMGHREKVFSFLKFRTMVANAEGMVEQLKQMSERLGPVFKMRNDPRVTRVGRVLRRFSLDELPQLYNVLRGDMSLVGPRPQVLWEAAAYDGHARKRLRILPGMTGLWQVSGRAALSYQEMIDLDIFYLENWSLGLDLKILLRTLPAVLAGRGAY